MLPLVTAVLPTPPPPSVTSSVQQLPVGAVADAVAASRQQLPTAVAASGAPAAFSPNVPQWRQAQLDKRVATVLPSTVAADAEPEAPAAPTLTLPAAPLPDSFFTSQPLTLGVPLTSQLATQFLAQQADATPPSLPLPVKNANPNDDAAAQVRDIRIARGDYALGTSRLMSPQVYGAALPAASLPRMAQQNGQGEWRSPPVGKKPGVASARGAAAYGVAEARNRLASVGTDATL